MANPILGCHAGGIPDNYPPEGCDDPAFWTSRLTRLRCNVYNYIINVKDSWDFLLKWLEYTRKNPPFNFWIDLRGFVTEPESYPHGVNFAAWGREIANLSKRYPHLTGFSIDDFCLDHSAQREKMRMMIPRRFEITKTMMQECWGITPEIQFLPVVYPNSIHLMELCKDYVSGIIYYNWKSEEDLVEAKTTFPGKKIVAGIYAKVGGKENPPQYVEKGMLTAKRCADGMMIFNVPENDPAHPIGKVVKNLFNQWSPTKPLHAGILGRLFGRRSH